MKFFMAALFICGVVFGGLAATAAAQDAEEEPTPYSVSHPLDALTPQEIEKVADLLKMAGAADEKTLFAAITLLEPDKQVVRRWVEGSPFGRRALAILRHKQKTYEARVDLVAGMVEDVQQIANAQPMIMDVEWIRARDAFVADARFLAAMKKRGIKPGENVFCTPNSAGPPSASHEGRRVLKVPCFSTADKLHPALARPIEGLMGIVDSETGEVLDVLDAQNVHLPPAPAGYGDDLPRKSSPIKPVDLVTPQGPNIQLSGNLNVRWLKWSFHVRSDKRAGVVVSLVRFRDGERERDIAYQINVSEMFVPYMDPDPTWAYRTFMDAGEFGLGYLMSSLEPGVDCPAGSFYLDLSFPNDIGGSFVRERALCIFERNTGDPAWRHYSGGRKTVEGEPQIELVVRHTPTLGNYDYVVDYVFSPQGNIRLRVGATGFDAIKSVAAKDMDSDTAKEDTTYGNLIAPYTVAPFHDHYFSFRLDLDADGVENAFARSVFLPTPVKTEGRKEMWTLKTQRYAKEGPIVPDHTATGGESWQVVNTTTKNALKQSPSLWLNTHHDAQSILSNADPAQARAQFSSAQFWVSRHKGDEVWASGLYPNLAATDLGLPAYVGDGEDIIGQDIVTWYTMGFRHVTRPEDFPILPTFWHEMTIRPAFFFDMDPSMTFNSGLRQTPQ
jgi:primary-amine oxidase